MASLLAMVFAGFAFAGAGKAVDAIAGDHPVYLSETKRHNEEMERYTQDKMAYDKQIRESMIREHNRDREEKSAQIRHVITESDIDAYARINHIKRPVLSDYLTHKNTKTKTSDTEKILLTTVIGGVAVTMINKYV